jgi:hypothetical protein
MSARKQARQNQEARRVRKAIKHGIKRKLSPTRMEGMQKHLAIVLTGGKYEVNEAKARRRAEHEKRAEAKRGKTQTTPKEWIKLVEDVKAALAPN